MDAYLERKNSEELYRLYQEGKNLRLSNNILAFVLLSAIEEASNHFIEILLSKCGNSTLMRNITARIYNKHEIKYELFLVIYYTMQNYDVETIIERVKQLSSKPALKSGFSTKAKGVTEQHSLVCPHSNWVSAINTITIDIVEKASDPHSNWVSAA